MTTTSFITQADEVLFAETRDALLREFDAIADYREAIRVHHSRREPARLARFDCPRLSTGEVDSIESNRRFIIEQATELAVRADRHRRNGDNPRCMREATLTAVLGGL